MTHSFMELQGLVHLKIERSIMGSKLRASDESRESIMTKLCAHYVFDDDITIITDKTFQVKGVDAIANGIKIDFKSQLSDRYVGNPTNTFALELQTNNRYGEPMTGWFLDEEKITDEYGFAWIPSGVIVPDFTVNQIEYMQVNIHKLKTQLFSEISHKDLQKIINCLYGTSNRKYLTPNYKVVSSGQLFEQPINLVVNKDYLKQFATRHCIVFCNN